jgi:hypothetical protein
VPTIAVGTVPGGFGNGTCLTEALADAGAVLLPYSYTGATLSPDGTFAQKSYTGDDSKQPLCTSVKSLVNEIISVHSNWPDIAIFLIGHSYGGLVAETWWYDQQQPGGGQCGIPGGMSGVDHVFSLDSPINGVQKCTLAAITTGEASQTWCSLWGNDFLHGVPNGRRIAAVDNHELSYTAVGTPNDPTYGLLGGGGGLEAQLVYDCFGNYDQNDPAASCIDTTGGSLPVSYPSASPQCDGTSGNIYGTTGHDIVKTCPAVIQMILQSLRLATTATSNPSGAPTSAPSLSPTSSCTSQAFLNVVKSSGPIQPTISGPPTCADGYAVQTFTAGPGGQAAQFFFKQDQNGSWTLIEGGDAISSIACQVIPAKVLKRLGALCPPAAYALSPGHATPKEAVNGFFHARLQGNETLACSYASPASRASCSSQVSQVPAITGNIALHNAVVSGKFALVEVTGSLCYPGRGCEYNKNPLLNMPASLAFFQQVYDDLVKSTTYTFSPYPCIRVGGMWYINFGP